MNRQLLATFRMFAPALAALAAATVAAMEAVAGCRSTAVAPVWENYPPVSRPPADRPASQPGRPFECLFGSLEHRGARYPLDCLLDAQFRAVHPDVWVRDLDPRQLEAAAE